jgi:hypothetical protein
MDTDAFRPGDRVRVVTDRHAPDILPGDRGEVVGGPYPAPSGGAYYLVALDGDASGAGLLFFAEDIGPDV